MRKRVLVVLGTASALVAASLYLTLTAGAAKTVSAKNLGGGSCYPTNEFQTDPGTTHAKMKNVQSDVAVTIEPSLNGTETLAKGNARVTTEFTVIDGVSLSGYATVLFNIGGSGKGKFESRCIVEASTDSTTPPDLEAEFEGTVTGLPFSKKAQNAVLSVSGSLDDNGDIQFHLSIEQGTTCNETKGEIGMAVPKPSGKATGKLSADDTTSGRWGVPIGFDPSLNNPCPDVFNAEAQQQQGG